jgi:hypothetical protein
MPPLLSRWGSCGAAIAPQWTILSVACQVLSRSTREAVKPEFNRVDRLESQAVSQTFS